MTLGDVIFEYRSTHGLSMEKFAELSGISKGYISMLERNKTQRGEEPSPSVEMYRSVAKTIGTDIDELIRMVDGKIALIPDRPLPSNIMPLPKTYKVPLLGTIACGEPILAVEEADETTDVPEDINADFALRCKGDSMVNAGIQDGDIVYIRHQEMVENGEIAAVMVGDEEATLKRFKRTGDTVLLIPENSSYDPLVFRREEMNTLRIVGKVVGYTHMF